MFDIHAYFHTKQIQINNALSQLLENSARSERIAAAMKYSVMAGGKRLRPILCMASAEAVGGNDEDALTTACALELIHTYSLIHDDLPAMDNDELRRGKQTCHVAFDEATAILTGDAMLTLAFQLLSRQEGDLEQNALKYMKVIQIISSASGPEGMVAGQMKDIAAEGTTLSLENLEEIYFLKTGALIEASVCAGATIADGTLDQIISLRSYARNIGLAFQIVDDILNIEGDPAVMGKASGTDNIRQKGTFPALAGIQKSFQIAENLVKNALQSINQFDNKSDPLRSIARYIVERKK